MDSNEKCIQSFMPHGMEFNPSLKPEDPAFGKALIIPAGHVNDNYVIASDSQIAALADDKVFKSMLEARLIRILGAVPAQYANQQTFINDLRGKLEDEREAHDKDRATIDALNAKIAELEKTNADLKSGSAIPSVSAEELKKRVEANKK